MSKYTEQSWLYKAFVECYLRYSNNLMMIRKHYVVGLENLPQLGERFFIVSNHQNAANDPINIAFSLPRDRRIGFMTRADAFNLNSSFSKLIRWLGLVPVFRAGWEGAEALEKNNDSFDEISTKINDGMPIVVFPEGTHAQGHYLLPLSTGTARMAFHVAEQNGWKEDIKILPVAHHYEDYFNVQHDFLLTIGQPISLKPYYEEYQSKPYTVLRRVKKQMCEQIQQMMLDEGETDYEVKDFLRTSLLNESTRRGRSVALPERLAIDKKFIASLIQSPNYSEIIPLAKQMKDTEDRLGIDDSDTLYADSSTAVQTLKLAGSAIIDLILLPLWIISLWPNLLCYRIPLLLLKTDIMFVNTFRFILNVLVLYPLFALITTAVIGFNANWTIALIYLAFYPSITLFSWYEWLHIRQTIRRFRVLTHGTEIASLKALREKIGKMLSQIAA
ncbi:MAG: 1-acyl-sn-glycerol-3-phosphate acyltransferase [Bacteroidales bacterium]|nr:1-acyl-sn-glycerol-3-phosphate acyltransferase [Candidatus Liminaster caballi]